MTELRAMILVGVGTVLLSAVMDVVLLLVHAGGTALSVALALSFCVGSVVMNKVMGRYESLGQRRKREAELTLR